MAMFLFLLSVFALSRAHDLPFPEIRHLPNNKGAELRMQDVPGAEHVIFKYVPERQLDRLVKGQATKGLDGYWRFHATDLDLSKVHEVVYGVTAVFKNGDERNRMETWNSLPVEKPRQRMRRGAVVFRDDFSGSGVDKSHWRFEVSMYGGENWEFQVYTPESRNAFTRNGVLFLKPTFTVDHPKFSEAGMTSQVMDMNEMYGYCTNNDHYGCKREGKYGLLPPVMSAKIKSIPTIRYGTVEVRARIPKGDWIWPAIWLLPRDSRYGGWPRSGEIDIMESRGNTVARSNGGGNQGVGHVSSTLHWGPDPGQNKYYTTTGGKDSPVGDWHASFHTYKLEWSPDHIITYVDGQQIMRVDPPGGGFWQKGGFRGGNLWAGGSKMAPFDQQFYLILNVAVGGTNGFFPDSFRYDVRKPWPNSSQHANEDFWNARREWAHTWNGDDVAMQVDYIEMRSW